MTLAKDLDEVDMEVLGRLAAAAASCRTPDVDESVLASLARRGYLEGEQYRLTHKALDALANADAP